MVHYSGGFAIGFLLCDFCYRTFAKGFSAIAMELVAIHFT